MKRIQERERERERMQRMMVGEMGWREGGLGMGSMLATLMFFWVTLRQLFPEFSGVILLSWSKKRLRSFYPYVHISFPELLDGRFKRSTAFSVIESYLSATCSGAASGLRAELGKDSADLVFSMDEHQEVVDSFEGVSFWWRCSLSMRKTPTFSFLSTPDEKRTYRLTFHRRHRRLVEEKYLKFVMEKGKEIAASRRQRKLFTNSTSREFESRGKLWSHVPFEHPSRFETLAMDPVKKQELLHGPPGTGKSSMIAAMANLLEYDVYDLELTAVKDNSTLRRLLIETTGKSIIVVEDIDCSLELAGKRKKKSEEEGEKIEEKMMGRESEESRVTLSGLLNFIDGLWSACGGERIIVFTTNHLEKLDPALIRRGRMDKHVELSYCRFEGFKVLAKNYLGITEHLLFDEVKRLLEEVEITPADVAEVLLAGSRGGDDVVDGLREVLRVLAEKKAKAEEKTESVEAEVPAEKVSEGMVVPESDKS